MSISAFLGRFGRRRRYSRTTGTMTKAAAAPPMEPPMIAPMFVLECDLLGTDTTLALLVADVIDSILEANELSPDAAADSLDKGFKYHD